MSGTSTPTAPTFQDYFFPYTAKYHAVYLQLLSSQSGGQAYASTGSVTVSVLSFGTNVATASYANFDGSSTDTGTEFFSIQPDGSVSSVLTGGSGTSASTMSFSFAPQLLTPGATVTVLPASQYDSASTLTQVGTESVSVPAGTYVALKCLSSQGSPTGYQWYAPNVGLVKSTSTTTINAATISTELDLESFTR